MKKHLFTGLLLLLNMPFLLSQDYPIEFRHLDTEDGLDQPFPYSIIQDQKGFIWIAGENGLWRYSGSEFKHFHHSISDSNSLAYDFVWTVYEDSKGNIWAGTYGGGLSKYDPVEDQFTNYTHSKEDSTSISDNKIRGIEEDHEGNLWIGTNKGLNKLDPISGEFTSIGIKDGLYDLTVRTIKQSKDQKKLFICTANGLDIYDLASKTFEHIGTENGLRYPYLYDLLETNKNELWVATGGGVEKIDLNTREIEHIPNEHMGGKGLSHYVTFSIYQNPENPDRIWFGTMNGINFYEEEEDRFHWIDATQKDVNNIGGDNIYGVFEDQSGGLWAAVNNAGLYHSHPTLNKFELKSFLPRETDKYLNRYTGFIRHNEDELLILTYNGLISWNQKKGVHELFQITDGDAKSINRLTQIKKWDKNRYLISTWGNFIYLWNHQSKKLTPLKSETDNSNLQYNLRLHIDHNKRIWLGNSLAGLHEYDLDSRELKAFSVSDLSNTENSGDEYIKYIIEDQSNRLWVGTADGLHLYNDENRTFLKFNPSRKKGHLSNGNINHISLSNNNGLWISTELGLNFFNFADSSFTRYFKKDGLPSNVISSALEDNQGNLWVATASGLAKMNEIGDFSRYDQDDGLREEYFIFGSAYKDINGQLYFGTSREMVIVNPEEMEYNKTSPLPYFSHLSINNQIIDSDKRPDILKKSLAHTESITLQPEDILFSIYFDALNLSNGHKNKYSVIMEGLEDKWRPFSPEKSINFSKLSAGDYKLKLKALNDENIESKEQASINIKVLPYWYNSHWFRMIFGFSIASIFGLVISWRFKQIRNTTKKLEHLVNKRTGEVLSQKEEIESQNEKLVFRNDRIELLLRELNHRIKNNLQLVSSILNLHSRTTQNLDAKMALTEGKLRMQALSLLHQKLYMTEKYTEVNCKEYINELTDYLSVAFRSHYSDVKFNLDIDNFKLNLDQAVPLGLILNELVTNSLKHSGKEELLIDLGAKIQEDEIIITLTDNGAGLTLEQFEKSSSFGVSMIKSLVEQINGKLTVGRKNGPHFQLIFKSKEPE